MGNQLVGIAPSQIFPVEHYLTEHGDLQFDKNLGSTRFFKVARAKSQEGLIVVKVFAIHDPTLPLAAYRDRVEQIRGLLQSAMNCVPFQKALLTDKAVFLMREYVKYSLYDRISTRPFLTAIEKKWITFQLLYALHQCHRQGVCHGDIKLENIMITSWNLVLLVDFASFKPTYLPEDNPADFSYFFDTSRRRTCYIAPERFIKTLNTDTSSQLLLPEEHVRKGDLAPSMDIFSAGCALLELFNEGHSPFDFSQLLAYCSDEYSPSSHLEKVEDKQIRKLLASMLQKEPSQRQLSDVYLDENRGKIFPEYFYTFLQSYMLLFSAGEILTPDEKIIRLKKDIKNIINILKPDAKKNQKVEVCECNHDDNIDSTDDPLVLIIALVTSCIRGLRHCASKLQSLDTLYELAEHTSADIILERILPYVFQLVGDPYPRVRIKAIQVLTDCLSLVKCVPCSDANTFPEYVLPGLATVTQDECVMVRAAYAKNVAELAHTALRFLEHSQMCDAGHGDSTRPSYDTELQTLHEMIQQAVEKLLTDPLNLVKQTLMENGITKLCIFFGKQKANDVLLSHLVTFLNDKDDRHLRSSFFDCIVGVAAYVGSSTSCILMPLLLQGLADSEEFVMVKAINAMTTLTELNLLQKCAIYELLSETKSFLAHPNLWIRQAVVGFMSTACHTLSDVDIQCRLEPLLQMYLNNRVIQLDQEVLLLDNLSSPIPRIVYNSVIKCADIGLTLEILHDRQKARSLVKAGHVPQTIEPHPSLKNLFRRLLSEGMTECVENQLIIMSKHLLKINHQRSTVEAKLSEQKSFDGQVLLNGPLGPIPHHSFLLKPEQVQSMQSGSSLYARKKQTMKRTPATESHPTTMNEEWLTMFGTTDLSSTSPKVSESGISCSPSNTATGDIQPVSHHNSDVELKSHERSHLHQYHYAPCHYELKQLKYRKLEQLMTALNNRQNICQAWEPVSPPPGWRMKSSLVAHLHEHRGSVNRLVTIPDTSLFASCSSDGCIKIWDCSKMEGRNIANRSRQMYSRQSGPLIGMAVCENNQSLAVASQNGSLFVVRIEANSNKMSVVANRQLDIEEEGCAVDIHAFDSISGSQSTVVYASMYGTITGWDLRMPGDAWKLESDLRKGVITSFCIDARHSWITVGTSNGHLICYDLRFQLPITTISHPTGARIRKLVHHPTEQSLVIAAVQGNNEVSFWNLETQSRQYVLWASPTPPLSRTEVGQHSVCAMYGGCIDQLPFLFTGGTDMRIRFWYLEVPDESNLVIPAANDNVGPNSLQYVDRLIDGSNVILEVCRKHHLSMGFGSSIGAREEAPRPGPEHPQAGHHDWISDLALCQASQCFLLSGSRDGVIKVWK